MTGGKHYDRSARLEQRLEEAEATIQALIRGQVDAVASANAVSPVLLKDAQDALRRSEARFRALVEKSHDAIGLLGADGTVLFVSSAIKRMLGYSVADVVERSFRDFVHPDDLAAVEERFAAVLAQPGVCIEAKYRALHRDGSVRYIETVVTNRLDDPAVQAIVSNFRDVTDRDAALEALRASERQFRAVFDAALVPILVANDDGRYVDTNPAGCELLGRSREEVLELRVNDVVSRADDPDSKWQQFRRSGELRGELRIKRPDGTLRDVEFAATANVLPGRHLSMLRDVTDQKRTRKRERVQLALAQLLATAKTANEAFEAALEALALPLGADVALLRARDDTTGKLRHAGAWTAPGAQVGRLVGLASERAVDDGSFVAELERIGLGGALVVRVGDLLSPVAVLEYFLRDPPFPQDQLEAFAAALGRQLEEFLRRRAAEEALRQRESSLAEAERIAHLGAWSWDLAQNTITWSDEHYRIFGLTPGSVEPSYARWRDAIHPEDRERVESELQEALRARASLSMEYRIVLPNGGERFVVTQCSAPEAGPDGVPARVSGTLQDVTERRSLEDQLRVSQKMEAIGRLAGGVAHDFNNLLTAILASTEFVLEQVPPGHPFFEDLDGIRTSAQRASALTRQLLAFSRRQQLTPLILDPGELVRGMERMLVRLIGEDVRMVTRVEAESSRIRIDPGQLEQVVMNLVLNARDALAHGGTIEVSLRNLKLAAPVEGAHAPIPAGRYVVLEVKDTGSGMSPEVQRQVFEPFFTTKEPGKGTGLGLATVHGIVHQSGGHIVLTSALGKGTSFALYFPRVEEAAQSASQLSTSPPGEPVSEQVLLVEDDRAVRRAAKRILQRGGYTVVEAASGEEALQLLAESRFDALVTDIVMPGLQGPDLAERLTSLCPDLRTLFMSGYSHDVLGGEVDLPGRTAFLNKPFSSHQLLTALRRLLDARA